MQRISTLEQLNRFTRSREPLAEITGELAARISSMIGFNFDTALPISYERTEHRDMNRDVIAVTEVHWVQFGNTRIDLDQIFSRLGSEKEL